MPEFTAWFEDDLGNKYPVPDEYGRPIMIGRMREGGEAAYPGSLVIPIKEITESASVSRQHAKMIRAADGWKITDLGSTHGTRVGSKRLGKNETAGLHHGSPVSLGRYKLRFQDLGNAETAPPPGEAAASQGEAARDSAPSQSASGGTFYLDILDGSPAVRTRVLPKLKPGGSWKIGRQADPDESAEFVRFEDQGPYLSVSRRHLEVTPLGDSQFRVVVLSRRGARVRERLCPEREVVQVTSLDPIMVGPITLFLRDFERPTGGTLPAEAHLRDAASKTPEQGPTVAFRAPEGSDPLSHLVDPESRLRASRKLINSLALVAGTSAICIALLIAVRVQGPVGSATAGGADPGGVHAPLDRKGAVAHLLRDHGLAAYGILRATLALPGASANDEASIRELDECARLGAAVYGPGGAERDAAVSSFRTHARRLLDLNGIPDEPAWLAAAAAGVEATPSNEKLQARLDALAEMLKDPSPDTKSQRDIRVAAEMLRSTFPTDTGASAASDGVTSWLDILRASSELSPDTHWTRLRDTLASRDPIGSLQVRATHAARTRAQVKAVESLPPSLGQKLTSGEEWTRIRGLSLLGCELTEMAAAYAGGHIDKALAHHAELTSLLARLKEAGIETNLSVRSRTEIDRLRLQLEDIARIQKLKDPCSAAPDIKRLRDDLLVKARTAPLVGIVAELAARCGGAR